MNPHPLPLAVVSLALLAGAGAARGKDDAPVPADSFRVPLSRPVAVGDRFKEITTAEYLEISRTRNLEGISDSASATFKVSFEADQEVLAVTPKGAPKAYRLEMKKFVKSDASGTKALFKPGSIVLGMAEGDDSVFLLDGKKLRGQEQSLCSDLFGMSSKDEEKGMDEAYGTDVPRKVGESWLINPAKAEVWFTNPREPKRILGLTGESRLVKRFLDQGEDCLQIGTTIAVRYNAFAMMVPGVAAPEIQFMHAMLRTLPVDPARMEHGYTSLRRTRITTTPDDLPPGTTREVIVENHYDTKILPMQANPHPEPLLHLPKATPGHDEADEAPDPNPEPEQPAIPAAPGEEEPGE